ncbi:hypothetical protein J2S70_000874 [Trueperella bonasi]|uniref:DUF1801 domain-containing protein n=1 Tax=Trueperella bonasi TaxID=312286 RepID=A0ABT9NGI5_9ACTO|nr:hypothetical protein [Trueperella bonasi]MDP9806292.1 hypothetical protein [Trueperella bonasi]
MSESWMTRGGVVTRRTDHSSPAREFVQDVPVSAGRPASCLQPIDCIDRYPLELQSDARALFDLLSQVTGCEAVMRGPSVIGFGQKKPAAHPESPDDGFEIGFTRRGCHLVLVLRRYADYYAEILARLGDVTTGRNAIALPAFEGIDVTVLRELIERAWADRTRAD